MKKNIFTTLFFSGIALAIWGQSPKILIQNGVFVDETGDCFAPFGYNYLGAEGNALLDDAWQSDPIWASIVADFEDMKDYGANTVRIHLQFNKFMDSPSQPVQAAYDRLAQLVQLAASKRLYLLITGLGAYRAADQPAWYKDLDEQQRWATQAVFWAKIAETVGSSSAVFSYDLMNEPVMGDTTTWLPGAAFGGFHFVQNLTRTPNGRTFEQIAEAWALQMTNAIRQYDTLTPITTGFIGCGPVADWSRQLDYISAHIYPQNDTVPGNPFCNFNLSTAIQFVQNNQDNKPFVISEIAPLYSFEATDSFMKLTCPLVNGWLNHYGGKNLEELSDTNLVDLLNQLNLRTFKKKYPELHRCQSACGSDVAVLEGCEPDPQLVACYHFNGSWEDGSGNGLHLEPDGTSFGTGQNGQPNTAAAIDNPFLTSPPQFLTGPDDERTRPRSDRAFTIVARVFPRFFNAASIWAYDDYDDHDGDTVLLRDFVHLSAVNAALNNAQGNGDAFRFRFSYGSKKTPFTEDSETIQSLCFPFERWYNVCAVYDTGSDSTFLFVDGHLQDATAHNLSEPWASGGQYPMIGRNRNYDFFIPGYFNGAIDFLKFFDRALSPAEIAAYTVPEQDTTCTKSVNVSAAWSPAQDVRIFPNPAQNEFYIASPEFRTAPVQVSLYTTTGRLVWHQTAVPHDGRLDIPAREIAEGFYLIRGMSGARYFSGKIAIMR
jgi:hypothetical protein